MRNSQRREYEEAFGELVGAAGARAFGLGRQALVISLKALGINVGDKVGVCGYTCLSVAEAVKVCGATPIYLDVDKYLCIEPKEILRQGNCSLKVVILQHTFGIPGRLEELLSGCHKIGAKVIEDCAHSLGCFWKGKPLGKFGEAAIYCSEWGKAYSTGQGGMLTVNSKRLLDKVDEQIEELVLPASTKSELILEFERRIYPIRGGTKFKTYLWYIYNKCLNTSSVKNSSKLKDEFSLQGYVRLAGEMTAKAGLKQLANWPNLKDLRRKNTEMIEKHFSKAGLPLWPKPDEADVTMLRYPLLTPHRTRILKSACKQRLDISGWYVSPVHPLKGDDLARVDYREGSCQRSPDMIKRLVYLPTGFTLDRKRLEAMMSIICDN